MTPETLLLVGDKFSEFTVGKDALTISQLKELLVSEDFFSPYHRSISIILGQGVSDDALGELLNTAPKKKNYRHFDLSLLARRPERANQRLSHKANQENTLLSVPKRLSEDHYQMQLMVDDSSELMNDHQTGQHLQGMLLVEAARQAQLIVAESEYIDKNSKNHAFVFNDMSIHYNNFAFPFEALVDYKITSKTIKKANRMRFVGDITIQQCGVTVASFESDFSVVQKNVIFKSEKSLAEKALEMHLLNNKSDFQEAASA